MRALLDALQIGGDGVEDATVLATNNEVALPTLTGVQVIRDGAGPYTENARFVLVSFEGVAPNGVVFRPGLTGFALTDANGFYIESGMPGLIINCTGATHIIHRATVAAGVIHVVPLANQ